uniref:Uncharacterized protein n=1 Tax=Anguilla anguilla TaxID=7936 RepID=A0A0E9S0B5_ANGAN
MLPCIHNETCGHGTQNNEHHLVIRCTVTTMPTHPPVPESTAQFTHSLYQPIIGRGVWGGEFCAEGLRVRNKENGLALEEYQG